MDSWSYRTHHFRTPELYILRLLILFGRKVCVPCAGWCLDNLSWIKNSRGEWKQRSVWAFSFVLLMPQCVTISWSHGSICRRNWGIKWRQERSHISRPGGCGGWNSSGRYLWLDGVKRTCRTAERARGTIRAGRHWLGEHFGFGQGRNCREEAFL